MSVQLLRGDALEVLATLPEHSVDAIIADPPAGISFMSAKWDSDKGGRMQWIAWLAAIMVECRRVIKPGGHALVWALPRTAHWTGTAIEDAGWKPRDCLVHLFATGFPKSISLGEGRGTALKPAHEMWWLCRAPLSEKTLAANVQRWGCGALNIDTCRIGTDSTIRHNNALTNGNGWGMGTHAHINGSDTGRWPANLVLSCCGEDPHLEGCPVRDLDAQSGQTSSLDTVPWVGQRANRAGFSGLMPETAVLPGRGDTGGASRFFFIAKPSSAERDRGIGGSLTSPAHLTGRIEGSAGLNSPRASQRSARRNIHPTVKPLALMHYLVRLITPPGGTVLDPFCGSGTTLVAAASEGCSVIGIDLDADYLNIARQRLGLFAAVGQ